MGIVNVTPDSFSDGGRFDAADSAVAHGLELAEAGADIVDVGGESTRPGADPVDEPEELARVEDVVRRLARAGVTVSIDTMKPNVAAAAIEAGAAIVNDVGGLGSEAMRRLVADSGVGAVIMHMKGEPRSMQHAPVYADVVAEVAGFLHARVELAIGDGIDPRRLAIDPGIGFGKTAAHNLKILAEIAAFTRMPHPVVVGASRKRFLGDVLGIDDPADRDRVTAILSGLMFMNSVGVVRVHDVGGSQEARALVRAIVSNREGNE
jgi:dihydropteroate synthase